MDIRNFFQKNKAASVHAKRINDADGNEQEAAPYNTHSTGTMSTEVNTEVSTHARRVSYSN